MQKDEMFSEFRERLSSCATTVCIYFNFLQLEQDPHAKIAMSISCQRLQMCKIPNYGSRYRLVYYLIAIVYNIIVENTGIVCDDSPSTLMASQFVKLVIECGCVRLSDGLHNHVSAGTQEYFQAVTPQQCCQARARFNGQIPPRKIAVKIEQT